MKYRLLIALSVFLIKGYAQENAPFDGHNYKAPYFLDTPQHWGIERFPIPIQFAPSIAYKGVEDIRFTPGWAKKDSEEYWSYVFLWYLDGAVTMDVETIKKNLTAYYTGLMKANADPAKAATISGAIVTVKKIVNNKKAEQSFEAAVNTLDYMSWKPMQLNLRIHLLSCKEQNKTIVFHMVSPKAHNDAVWTTLIKFWDTLRCKK